MLAPRIKIATNLLRILSKPVEYFHRRHSLPISSFGSEFNHKERMTALNHTLYIQAMHQLKRHFPNLELILESSSALDDLNLTAQAKHRWILEPLDAAENFLHTPLSYRMRLSEQNGGQISFSVIYHADSDVLYSAERGYGVRMNQQRLQFSNPISEKRPWVIGAPSALLPLKGCLNHIETLCAQKHFQNPLKIFTTHSLIHQITEFCQGHIDVCWSGELSLFQKKLTGFWIKETAAQRVVMQNSLENPYRSWIFGKFPPGKIL